MKYKAIIFFSCLFVFNSCATIYLHNGDTPSEVEILEWHHGGIFDLVEFSKPVDLSQRCSNKEWQTVKIEKSPLCVLVDIAEAFLIGNLYDPWIVETSCK
jgi:hypothetical protein